MTTESSPMASHGGNGQAEIEDQLPMSSLFLELCVQDRDVIAALCNYPEGEPRDEFAVRALRIGVLALQQVRAQLDGEAVRRESDRLLESLDHQLSDHARTVQDRLTTCLKEYFDPQSGRFDERVRRLIDRDGELEQVLHRQVGAQVSELCKALAAHFGSGSPLMKYLGRDQADGFLSCMQRALSEQLTNQRDQVLRQFSMDNKEGALCRFIEELTTRHSKAAENIDGQFDKVLKQFSLNEEDSALSKLVRNVENAQRKITNEFSLDNNASALSRLKNTLESTHNSINMHLTLDDENSALARVRRELATLLKLSQESNQKFQDEIKQAVQTLVVRKQEAARSTTHGLMFEDALFSEIQREAQKAGDIATRVGSTTGCIAHCKKGDYLVELGPEAAASGSRIVVEAKESGGYDLAAAHVEIEQARKNRTAEIGLFVFSKQSAPGELLPLARYGNDIVVVWDAEDPVSDLYLQVALTLARALCVRSKQTAESTKAEWEHVDRAVVDIEKQIELLAEIEKWAKTIQSNGGKILKRVVNSRKTLQKRCESLTTNLALLKAQSGPAALAD